jgi:hypothetical protein
VFGLGVKRLLFFLSFNETLTFWTDFLKNLQESNFMKGKLVPYVKTGLSKLIVAFSNFANTLKCKDVAQKYCKYFVRFMFSHIFALLFCTDKREVE